MSDLQKIGESAYAVLEEMVENLDSEDEDAVEAAREAIEQDPLSVEIKRTYEILLSTGGPAVRIIGELDSYGEPVSATLQAQDWFKPWTDYQGADEDLLLTYAQHFYFGEI